MLTGIARLGILLFGSGMAKGRYVGLTNFYELESHKRGANEQQEIRTY